MKFSEIIELKEGLETLTDKKVPIKLAYAIARNLKILNDVYDTYQSLRTKIITQYGKKDTQGKLIIDKNGAVQIQDISQCSKALQEILNMEEEIKLKTFPVEILEQCENNKDYDLLTPAEIKILVPIIEENEK